jgi:hypothetical protein
MHEGGEGARVPDTASEKGMEKEYEEISAGSNLRK